MTRLLRNNPDMTYAISRRWIAAVAACLFCLAGLAGQSSNYPFSVDSEKTPNGHRIVARNTGPAPVSVKVSLVDAQYIAADRPFPIYAVVPPNGGTLYLCNIRPAMPGVGYTFRTQSTWVLGDFSAVQSPDARYRLPYRDGMAFRLGQSPGGPITTHSTADSRFAVDIPMPEGTPILAAREGTVIHTEAGQTYGAQVPDMLDKANEIRILHLDGTLATYAHLAHGGVYVYPGQKVAAGQQIGLAGSTGYSSGPHLHFAVQAIRKNGDRLETVSLPFQFYVGNPPAVFLPQFGMLARADYASPGVVPGVEQATLVAATSARAAQQLPTAIGITVSIDARLVNWLEVLQAKASAVHGYVWLAIAGLVVFCLCYRQKRMQDRRRRVWEIVREPTCRERSDK